MNRIRSRVRLSAVVAAALALSLTACGGTTESGSGGDEKTFADDEFALTFRYPDDLRPEEITGMAESTGEAEARAALALDSENLVVVSKFKTDEPVTTANIDVVLTELDGVVGNLSGQTVHGQLEEVDGLPAVRYDDVALDEPAQGESRFLFVFDQRDQYQINCQSTPEGRVRLEAACDRVLDTLRRA